MSKRPPPGHKTHNTWLNYRVNNINQGGYKAAEVTSTRQASESRGVMIDIEDRHPNNKQQLTQQLTGSISTVDCSLMLISTRQVSQQESNRRAM